MRRDITGIVQIPYDRDSAGQPITYAAYQLDCGHTVKAAYVTGTNHSLSDIPYDTTRRTADCKKCKES